jgi:hypothetical protein
VNLEGSTNENDEASLNDEDEFDVDENDPEFEAAEESNDDEPEPVEESSPPSKGKKSARKVTVTASVKSVKWVFGYRIDFLSPEKP